jgi:hypothetical protein
MDAKAISRIGGGGLVREGLHLRFRLQRDFQKAPEATAVRWQRRAAFWAFCELIHLASIRPSPGT